MSGKGLQTHMVQKEEEAEEGEGRARLRHTEVVVKVVVTVPTRDDAPQQWNTVGP